MRARPRTWPSIRRRRLSTELLAFARMRPIYPYGVCDSRAVAIMQPAQSSVEIDPVCGMTIDPTTSSRHHTHGGRLYHFCSARCQTKFAEQPEKFLSLQGGTSSNSPAGTIYTCPMHPQIRQPGPGSCPICGMALEPVTTGEDTGPSPELLDMTRRFWIGTALAVPVVILEMGAHLPGLNFHHFVSPQLAIWVQFLFATPVVLWAGWLFFVRGWASVRNRSLNMFSLIALGIGTAFLYSLAATFAPSLFPENLRQDGVVPVITKPPPSSPCSFCWARFWNCAHASKPAAPFALCSISLQKRHGGSAPMAAKMTCRLKQFKSAIACACARATACRSMAWCSRAAARSTNPW